jgi:soluble lytic murein transglycosylase-like protein
VVVRVLKGAGPTGEQKCSGPFTVGRGKECDIQLQENAVSRSHFRVEWSGTEWCIKDLGSSNGTFINGQRIQESVLLLSSVIELGVGGPQISLDIETIEQVVLDVPPSPPPDLSTETQIIRRYFDTDTAENPGDQTMMFRRAFQRVQKKKSKKYQVFIGIALLLLVVAGSVIFYQKQKIAALHTTAENIFYLMKAQELQIGQLEELVTLTSDPKQVAELKAKRNKFTGMAQEYDSFVKELGIYAKVSEEEQAIMRIARVFGECEVNMPKEFVAEVRKYIGIWKSSDRLQIALNRAQQKQYTQLIPKILEDNNLAPHYFFLALQESNFDERAIGPITRYGHAKGMWQFIPQTASRYGLQVGPLSGVNAYDPLDDRFNFVKSTGAAAKYIKELTSTGAQASGLLAMASYNWGENNIRDIITRMPENPRERNFWRFLAIKNVPKETYDYVFLIFSAAVICDNPKLFGLDYSCPVFKTKEKAASPAAAQ